MKSLIVDELHDSIHSLLQDIGMEYHYDPKIDRDGIKSLLPEYDGLIIRSKTRVDADLLSHAPKLKFIARAGAGVDNLDEELLEQKGIKIFNAPEGNRDAVGEHTLGMILSLLNNLKKGDQEIHQGIWDREGNRGEELSALTVGLIGYGNMGKAVARRLKPMGCQVLAFDKYLENYGDEFVEEASLEELKEKTDILSLHIPLTSETLGMVNESFLSGFSKNLIFINTARGEIVPLQDLVALIKKEKIRKAGLDVLENEKLNTYSTEEKEALSYLTASNRVILSPHVAGWSFESYIKINQILVQKLQEFLEKFN